MVIPIYVHCKGTKSRYAALWLASDRRSHLPAFGFSLASFYAAPPLSVAKSRVTCITLQSPVGKHKVTGCDAGKDEAAEAAEGRRLSRVGLSIQVRPGKAV